MNQCYLSHAYLSTLQHSLIKALISLWVISSSATCTSPAFIYPSLRPLETLRPLRISRWRYGLHFSANEAFLFRLDLVNGAGSVAVIWSAFFLPHYRD
uniref:Uncharacterized protein n=1 Tax=Wuchereria bancrofti TaxID=6293 RepID=A0A1I8ERI3_WUCBA